MNGPEFMINRKYTYYGVKKKKILIKLILNYKNDNKQTNKNINIKEK